MFPWWTLHSNSARFKVTSFIIRLISARAQMRSLEEAQQTTEEYVPSQRPKDPDLKPLLNQK